jgi:hypothetical protein
LSLDLTDDDKLALAALLRRTIDEDRYPLSPRLVIMQGRAAGSPCASAIVVEKRSSERCSLPRLCRGQ